MKSLFLLFNHTLTRTQREEAHTRLGVARIVPLPEELQELWSHIPPDVDRLSDYLRPIDSYLQSQVNPGDYVLIQGDYGATCLMVAEAARLRAVPVYSTTARESVERLEGEKVLKHSRFRHIRFREYEI
ncbi:CRISPR-associated protein Csx20 [Nitratifractor sp.]